MQQRQPKHRTREAEEQQTFEQGLVDLKQELNEIESRVKAMQPDQREARQLREKKVQFS